MVAMAHIVERAKTGRAKCRGCGKAIAAGALRFGERLPNPFADDAGEMTHWFHVPCAAFMRPEPFLATLPEVVEPIDDRERLQQEAELGIAHRRLPRATTIGRASSGRAACRACKQPIEKGAWRISLMYYEDGRFAPSGFIHLGCAGTYFETTEILNRLTHFSPELGDTDWAEIRKLLSS
jgi:ribosomal protein L37AE/L43A